VPFPKDGKIETILPASEWLEIKKPNQQTETTYELLIKENGDG
jgi:hypothetical protein